MRKKLIITYLYKMICTPSSSLVYDPWVFNCITLWNNFLYFSGYFFISIFYYRINTKEAPERLYRKQYQNNKAVNSTFRERDPSLLDEIVHPLSASYVNDYSICFADTWLDKKPFKVDTIMIFAIKTQLKFCFSVEII
jgi:hypothetical protein